MAESTRYRVGQRWTFAPDVVGFEPTLVIGDITEAFPEWGLNDRTYTVYVRYSAAVADSIPADYDGVILSLTDAGLDRSVTDISEEGIELPWWWVYGRRFESQDKAPNTRSVLFCDRVGDVLRHQLDSAKQRLEDMQVMESALRKHREKYAAMTSRPAPSKSVAESWGRIAAWYAENAQGQANELAPGASDAEIEQFEKEIGAELPGDFKESARIHNGGGWWVPWRHGPMLSLEGILAQWRMYSEWQEKGEYAAGEDWIPRDIKGPIKPVFWSKRRIHVTDNSGNHLTLDLDPPADGKYGQVLNHSHEVGPTTVVASSWAEFLRMLVEDLDSGRYVYLESVGSLELVENVEKELAEGW